MPIKKRGGHRRGAVRRAGEGRKTGKGSVRPGSDVSSGKHRDAAPEQLCGSAAQRPTCGSLAKAGAASRHKAEANILMTGIAP